MPLVDVEVCPRSAVQRHRQQTLNSMNKNMRSGRHDGARRSAVPAAGSVAEGLQHNMRWLDSIRSGTRPMEPAPSPSLWEESPES